MKREIAGQNVQLVTYKIILMRGFGKPASMILIQDMGSGGLGQEPELSCMTGRKALQV